MTYANIAPEDWERAFNLSKPLGLPELFASAAHKALTTEHNKAKGDVAQARTENENQDRRRDRSGFADHS